MEEPNVNILTEAKTEYTKQLTNILTPLIKEGFNQLYEDACNFRETTKDPRFDDYSELQIFQDYLRKIPKWNQDIIDIETKRIKNKSRCEYLEDLIGAVFVSYAKVLSAIRLRNPTSQMKLKIPKLTNFIHKCYIEASRNIYQNVYLFDNEDISYIEKQKNTRDINNIIKDAIIDAVRKLMPIKDIIQTYLGKMYEDEETDISTIDNGFEQSAFMDFAKNNLRNNVEEIQSENELEESSQEEERSNHEEEERSNHEEEERSNHEEEFSTHSQNNQDIVPEPSGESLALSGDIINKIEESEHSEQSNHHHTEMYKVIKNNNVKRFVRNKDKMKQKEQNNIFVKQKEQDNVFVNEEVSYEPPF